MENSLEQLREHRFNSKKLTRSNIGSGYSSIEDSGIFYGLACGFISAVLGAIIGSIISYIIFDRKDAAGAYWGAAALFLTYSLFPILSFVFFILRNWRLPPENFMEKFHVGQKIIMMVTVSWAIVYGGNHAYPHIEQKWEEIIGKPTSAVAHVKNTHDNEKTVLAEKKKNKKSKKGQKSKNASQKDNKLVKTEFRNNNLPIKSNTVWALSWLSTMLFLFLVTGFLQQRHTNKYRNQGSSKKQQKLDLPFSLWIGKSTGYLADMSHGSSLAPRQRVSVSLADASQNILVLGGIGSGKTTRAMHPLLLQLLDQECGGLIFDIKGDFQKAVQCFSEQTNKNLICIGPGFQKMNLLAGLTPEIAASFLKSAFLLGGKGHGEAFWIDTATELCRNTLGLLSFIPNSYSLQGLYAYLFNIEYRSVVDDAVEDILPSLTEREAKLLKSYWQYHDQIFDRFDEKVKAGVNATIAQVLSPFNHPDLIETFCSSGDEHVPMEAVLNGAIYFVNLPLSVWGLGGKVVYSLIKLRFYNVMQQRSSRSEWDQERPVFFMCDEFQEIVSANRDGLSDLNFWDKSRSSKTIGIISAQAISSFYAAIGDRDITNALLQNFRQKICFRTEDTTTINYFHNLADKVEVERKTYSTSSGKHHNPDTGFLGTTSTSTSNTENTTFTEKSVLSPQLFRKLQPDQAVALLSVDGHSMDDVICTMSVYV